MSFQIGANTLIEQYQLLIILEIITVAAAVFITILLLYGMGPFRKLLFYKGPALIMTNPDNSYFIAKLSGLRKSLKIYEHRKIIHPFRAGLGTGYHTTGGPRLYFGYSPAEMAINMKLIPWAKKVLGITKERWDLTPQNWEQLCIVYYKDYIDRMLHPERHQDDILPVLPTKMTDGGQMIPAIDDATRTILETDQQLIQEIETGKMRPIIDPDSGKQLVDSSGRLLFHPPISVEEKEALIDRAENVMMTENPDIFNFDSVSLREVVLFRRSTFTDSDIEDAYQEGFAKARETQGRDNTRLFLYGMIIFWILIGTAILFQVLRGYH
jgi:hypothetical protein